MARRDVCDTIRDTAGPGGGKETVPRRFPLLGGEELIHALANEPCERLRPPCRERLEALVLVRLKLDLGANHDGTITLYCIHDVMEES